MRLPTDQEIRGWYLSGWVACDIKRKNASDEKRNLWGLRCVSQETADLARKERDGEWVEWLAGFICEDCSTPNFVNIVLPKDIWEQLGSKRE